MVGIGDRPSARFLGARNRSMINTLTAQWNEVDTVGRAGSDCCGNWSGTRAASLQAVAAKPPPGWPCVSIFNRLGGRQAFLTVGGVRNVEPRRSRGKRHGHSWRPGLPLGGAAALTAEDAERKESEWKWGWIHAEALRKK